MTPHSRRRVLRWLGVSLALPMLETATGRRSAYANPETTPPANGGSMLASKKKFIGCFFPDGAAGMINGDAGDWTYEGALSVLRERGLEQNVVLARGFRAQHDYDIHWVATAAFLSCNEVGSYDFAEGHVRAGERCGKTFDQYVADLEQTQIRSLHAGWHTVPGWDAGHDSQISIRYVNSVAWRDEHGPIQNTLDPRAMFTQVFGDGTSVADPHIQYLLKRKKSVLDGVIGHLKSFRTSISISDRPKMDAYEGGIREVENELSARMQANTCNAGPAANDPGSTYLTNFRTMQKIIVRAMQCNLTRAATIMYHEGIGDNSIDLNAPMAQHSYAHGDQEKLRVCTRLQVGLWAELLADLKSVGALEDTVVVLGSNMSDGKSHDPRNVPLMLASAGSELKEGQEIFGSTDFATEANQRNFADLYMDLFPLFGISKTEFGEGKYKSTGRASGILR